jgi:predicted transcriptional regulator
MGIVNWLRNRVILPEGNYVECPEISESEEGIIENFSDVMKRYSEKEEKRKSVNLYEGNSLFEDLRSASEDFLDHYLMTYKDLEAVAEEVERNKKVIQEKLQELVSLGLTESKTKKDYQEKLKSYEAFDVEKNTMKDRATLVSEVQKKIRPKSCYPYFLSFKDFITIRDKYEYYSPKPLSTYTGTVGEEIIKTLQELKKGLGGLISQIGTWKKEAKDNLLKPEQELVKTGFIKNIRSLNRFGDPTTDLIDGCLALMKDSNGFYISETSVEFRESSDWEKRIRGYDTYIHLNSPVENPIFPIPDGYVKRGRDNSSSVAKISDPPYMSSKKGGAVISVFPMARWNYYIR